jgi:Beta-propeller repeat
MKKITITVLLLCCSSIIYAQNLEWAKSIGGNSYDYAYSIDVSSQNNVYTTGFFIGTVDFDPSQNVSQVISSGTDTYITKFNNSGGFQWVKTFNGTNFSTGLAIKADLSENIYVTGSL